jgi:hypothetical protein
MGLVLRAEKRRKTGIRGKAGAVVPSLRDTAKQWKGRRAGKKFLALDPAD